MKPTVPVIAVVGWKNSGKTTMTVRLVEEITKRGLKVSTIKHAHHNFSIDDGATDSARHRRAGAGEVVVVSPLRWAIVNELEGAPEPEFAEVVSWLAPCDLAIVEGYKSQPIPKIEVRRKETLRDRALADSDMMVLAIASDTPLEGERRPVFDIDDIAGIADFIENVLGPFANSRKRKRASDEFEDRVPRGRKH